LAAQTTAGEKVHPFARRRILGRQHEIERLRRTSAGHRTVRQVAQRKLAKPAIGIHDDNDGGRVEREMPHTELQRIALAAPRRIGAHRHFDASRLYNRGCVVSAVVRHHENAVVGSELGLHIPNGRKYPHPLVMRRNEHGRSMRQCARRRN
jgi:hypothetical protein